MANAFLTSSIILREMQMQLRNNLVMGKLVHTGYSKEFKHIGDSVSIRKPLKFNVTDGETMVLQDLTEATVAVAMNQRKHVAFSVLQTDMTLKIEDFSKRYIQPAAMALANKIDYDLLALAKDLPSAVGTAGTSPATSAVLFALGQKMDEQSVPVNGRKLVINPAGRWGLAEGLKGVYSPTIVENIIREASIGRVADFDIFSSQNVQTHTKGVATGTPLVNGASQVGSSLVTDGWTNDTAGILVVGDIITIANVYAVNAVYPFSSTGALRQFVVTATVASGATTGPATVSIYPPIRTPVTATASPSYPDFPASTQANLAFPGPTVNALPADNAAITVVGSHAVNMAFMKEAFALVSAPLNMADAGGVNAEQMEYEGISITMAKGFDIVNYKTPMRFDVLYGVKTIYPELGCRLLG